MVIYGFNVHIAIVILHRLLAIVSVILIKLGYVIS